MNSRELTESERLLIATALRNDAVRVTAAGVNPDLMAALLSLETVDEEARRRLSDRAIAITKKSVSLELLADIIQRHGATITTPAYIPEQG